MGKLVGSFGKFPWIEVKRTLNCLMKKRENKKEFDESWWELFACHRTVSINIYLYRVFISNQVLYVIMNI